MRTAGHCLAGPALKTTFAALFSTLSAGLVAGLASGLAAGALGAGLGAEARAAEAPASPPMGRLGLRYIGVPEGILVTAVEPGMGAAAAGVQVGMIIDAVDGAPLPVGDSARAAALRGPPATTVRLGLSGPLDAKPRVVSVERREAQASAEALAAEHEAAPAPPPSARPGAQPAVVQDFRAALRQKSAGKARKATEALVAADYGGIGEAAAVGGALTVARNRPQVALAAARALLAAKPTDPTLLLRVADALSAAGDPSGALEALALRAATLPPELRLGDGRAVVTGSSSLRARGLEVEALAATGEREAAAERLRAMLPFSESAGLVAALGMAPLERQAPWRASVAPVPPFSLALADGGTWGLQAHDGQVRVLAFWATWCGPCAEELPELSKMAAEVRNAGLSVVAVSVDQGLSPAEVGAAAAAMGVELPVGLAPPGLSEALGISGIPAVRVIGRDGALRYAAHGYSAGSVRGVQAAIEEALADKGGGEVVIAQPWGPGGARLRYFAPAPGVSGVAVADGRLTVGRPGYPLVQLGPTGALAGEPEEGVTPPLEGLVWFDGPVGSTGGAPILRALREDGQARWTRGLPGPLVGLAVQGPELWVLTQRELVVLDAEGRALARRALSGLSIAENGAGEGVFVVTDGRRAELVREGERIVERAVLELPGAARVASGGEVADRGTFDLVSGRFGPGGARRVVVSRRDGGVVALDGEGAPAVAVNLPRPAALAVGDLDGDGQDELILRIDDRGVAVVDLRLP